ncbi:S1 family peptidase [Nocardia sp. NPDC005978]|uniref:S1 family peptidase n=1 Tax=unclassified Nocardia TaxID=2637762 RepID=UPI0033AF46AE
MLSLARMCTSAGSLSAATLFTIGVLLPGSAAADGPVPMGGGSGIAIGTGDPNVVGLCTLTAIGFDNADRLVGITAGHCGNPGLPVWSEAAPGAGIIGHFAEVDHYWDWAIIEFDAARVAPVRQVTQSVINGVGAPPGPLSWVCKNGRTTGFTCGPVWEDLGGGFSSHVCADYGDSGSPVLVNDRLVGMIISGQAIHLGGLVIRLPSCSNPFNPIHEPDVATGIDYILGDIDERGGVGAGFRLL